MPCRSAALLAAALCLLAPAAAGAPPLDCGLWEAVEPGDTFASIAARCGGTEAGLADLNPDRDPGALQMGSVVVIEPFESTPRPEQVGGPTGNVALDRYRADVRGLWRGDGGTCGRVVGTWSFDDRSLRGNATRFDLDGVFGTGDRIVAQTTRRRDGAPVRLILRPSGEALAITGPGIAADVTRCAARGAVLPPDRTGPGNGPRAAYLARIPGTWRGEGYDCADVVGTWRFRGDGLTANGNDYAIERFDGRPDAIRLALRRPTGEAVAFTLRPVAPGRIAVDGPGFVTALARCG